ncbi:hypothetical protein [Bowmanella dokdonensis]|uniref:Uncharacterized protein n=1 Tax=Bowmanella dokdonensis TaxID=751969 RepID=A0A939IM73_9ALTE|nr:hypothetical protein [Bowmanella dokdonensis]MBN7824998.1 hypothetical protein [Bowmanella dokdonensis]
MKNFTRTLVTSLILFTGQLAQASEILDQNWLENQTSDYIQGALSTLELPRVESSPQWIAQSAKVNKEEMLALYQTTSQSLENRQTSE